MMAKHGDDAIGADSGTNMSGTPTFLDFSTNHTKAVETTADENNPVDAVRSKLLADTTTVAGGLVNLRELTPPKSISDVSKAFEENCTKLTDRLGQLCLKAVDRADLAGKMEVNGKDLASVVEFGEAGQLLPESDRKLVEQIASTAERQKVEHAVFLIGRGSDKEIKQGEKLLTETIRDKPHLQFNQEFQAHLLELYVNMAAKRASLGLPPYKGDLAIGDVIPEHKQISRNNNKPAAKELFDQALNTWSEKGMREALPSFIKANDRAEQDFQADRLDRVNLFIEGLRLNGEIAEQSLNKKTDLMPLLDKKAKLAERETAGTSSSALSSEIRETVALTTAMVKIACGDNQLFQEGKRELQKHLSENPAVLLKDRFNSDLIDAFTSHHQKLDDKFRPNNPDYGKSTKLDNQGSDWLLKVGVGLGLVGGAAGLGLHVARSYRQAQEAQRMQARYGLDALTSDNANVWRTYHDPINGKPERSFFQAVGATRNTANRTVILENKTYSAGMDKGGTDKSIPLSDYFNPRLGRFGNYGSLHVTPINIEGKMFYGIDGAVYSENGRSLVPTNRYIAVPEKVLIRDQIPEQLDALAKTDPNSEGLKLASESIRRKIGLFDSITMSQLADMVRLEAEELPADKQSLKDGLARAEQLIRKAGNCPRPIDLPLETATISSAAQEIKTSLPKGMMLNQTTWHENLKVRPQGSLTDGRVLMTPDPTQRWESSGQWDVREYPPNTRDFDPKNGKYCGLIPINYNGQEFYASAFPGKAVFAYRENFGRMELAPVRGLMLASPGAIAYQANRPENPYDQAYKQVEQSGVHMGIEHPKLASQFTWSSVPTKEALIGIYNFAHGNATNPGAIVSMGAGNGYWEAMMEKMGLNLDGAKYDGAPIGSGKENRYYDENSKAWTAVAEGGPEVLAKHGDRTLLLSWPPHGDKFAHDSLAEYIKAAGDGGRLIFIGEQPEVVARQRGTTPLTGDTEFFNLLDREFQLVQVADLKQVDLGGNETSLDKVYMYERKPASNRPVPGAPGTISQQEQRDFVNSKSNTLSPSENRIAQFMKEAVFARDANALLRGVKAAAASENPNGIFESFQHDFKKLGLDVDWHITPNGEGNPKIATVNLVNKHNGWEVVADSNTYGPQVSRAYENDYGAMEAPFQADEIANKTIDIMLRDLQCPSGEFKTEVSSASTVEKFVEAVPEGWGNGAKSAAELRTLQLLREGVLLKDAPTLETGLRILGQSNNPKIVAAISEQFTQDMKSLGLEVKIFEQPYGFPIKPLKMIIEDPQNKSSLSLTSDSRLSIVHRHEIVEFDKLADSAREAVGVTKVDFAAGESALLKLKSEQPDLSQRVDQVLEKLKGLEKTGSTNERIRWSMSAEGGEFLISADGLERLEKLVEATAPAQNRPQGQESATAIGAKETVNATLEQASQSRILLTERRETDPSIPVEVNVELQKVSLPGGLEIFVDKTMEKSVGKYLEKYNQDATFKELLANRLKRQEEKIERETNAENKAKLVAEKVAMESEVTRYSSMPEAEKASYRETLLGEAMSRYSARMTGRQRAMKAVGTVGTMILVGMITEHAIDMIPSSPESDFGSVKPQIR